MPKTRKVLFAKQKMLRRQNEDNIITSLKSHPLTFTELLHTTGLARPTLTERLADMRGGKKWIMRDLQEEGPKPKIVYKLTSTGLERAAGTSLPRIFEGDADDPRFRALHAEIVALTRRVVKNFSSGAEYSMRDPRNQSWIGAFAAEGHNGIGIRFQDQVDLDFLTSARERYASLSRQER